MPHSTSPPHALPRRYLAAAGLASMGIAAMAQGQVGLDISPYLDGGDQIITGAWDDFQGQRVADLEHIFQIDLDPDDDFGTDSPAINTGANAFPAGTNLGMNFTSELFFWDGTGEVSFTPVSDGSEIRIFTGIDQGSFLNGTSPADPYFWAEVNVGGNAHEHAFSQFYGGDSTGLSDVGTVMPGIYYALGTVQDEGGVYIASDEVALVYNTGGDAFDAARESAAVFIETNVIPEPASLSLLAVGGLALLRRRR